VPPFDDLADAVHLLVDQRPGLADVTVSRAKEQISLVIQMNLLDPSETQTDDAGIGAGSDLEVEFQPPGSAMKYQVHSWVDLPISDPPILRYVHVPAAGFPAQKIMAAAGEQVQGLQNRRRITTEQTHSYRGRPRAREVHDHFCCGQKKTCRIVASQKPDLGIGLPDIGFKSERQPAGDLTCPRRERG
jgi:hypothetical protein